MPTCLLAAAGVHAPAAASPPQPPHVLPRRRAKRLKKLTRLFTCSAAQSATIRFRERTWLLTFIILAAHLCAFAVLVSQIEARYS